MSLLRTKATMGAVLFSAHIRQLSALASVLCTYWGNTDIVALSMMLFVSHASLNVAGRSVMQISYSESR